MAQMTTISLDDHFAEFAKERVRSGRFGSVDEVVRAGLQLLEEDEAKQTALRAALAEGEASGPPEEFDIAAFLRDQRER